MILDYLNLYMQYSVPSKTRFMKVQEEPIFAPTKILADPGDNSSHATSSEHHTHQSRK